MKKLEPEEAKIIQSYKYVAKHEGFMENLTNLYRASRQKAKEMYERSDSAAAYWSGRSDALEILLDNMRDADKIDLRDNI